MSENLKRFVPLAMLASGDEAFRDDWQDWLESLVPEMTLEDFDDIWARYEELKARRMAA
jgi:hypothetical protein